jgi:hypothetical protein
MRLQWNVFLKPGAKYALGIKLTARCECPSGFWLYIQPSVSALTAVVLKGDVAQYTPWRRHRSAETCHGSNLIIVFLRK